MHCNLKAARRRTSGSRLFWTRTFVLRIRRNFWASSQNFDTAVGFGDHNFLYSTDILAICEHLPSDLKGGLGDECQSERSTVIVAQSGSIGFRYNPPFRNDIELKATNVDN